MREPSDMTGKVALVTGAASGLGKATALRLAELGADLVVVDVQAEALGETAGAIRTTGRKALALTMDLTDRSNCAGAVAQAVAEYGGLDALCNVAGVMFPGATPK
ncbi:MAG: SDR family NAD(P)-dependent oxidoreductase [Sphingomonadaceae bacterium]